MTLASDAGRGPNAGGASDDSALLERIECEPVAASEKELADLFAELASLLLDHRIAQAGDANRGVLPTHNSEQIRRDVANQNSGEPPPVGDAA